jgi:hypothetical protein
MRYDFRGYLCAYLCDDCREDLSGVLVRLYRPESEAIATERAGARAKDTFAILSSDQVDAKASRLIAEGKTDTRGRFTVTMSGDQQDYDGEAFEIDVRVSSAPGQDGDVEPVQFSITVLQPRWRKGDNGAVAAWEYCLPHRFWCAVRERLDAWVICGQVLHCETGEPLGKGLTVRAFDRDWIQDDPLGSATTDGSGRFRIYYAPPAFKEGTFIDVELFGGPDIYFYVDSSLGTPLLREDPSRGRDSDRENAGPCFCVEICVEGGPEDTPDDEPYPAFHSIGNYLYETEIDSAPAGTGRTLSGDRAFYATLRLNGVGAKTFDGGPMEYKFQSRELDASGTPTGSWTDIEASQIAKTVIGTWEQFDPDFPGDPTPIKSERYIIGSAPGPNERAASIVNGWVQVPQESNVFAPSGHFEPNGNLIRLDSRTLRTFTNIDLTGLEAGNSVTSTGAPLGQNRHFALRMLVRRRADGATPPGSTSVSGACQHVAIHNQRYDNITYHPSWAGRTESDVLGVGMLDIQQLASDGCAEISGTLDVQFTAAHPNLGAVSIRMEGPGGPYSFDVPAATSPGDRFGTTSTFRDTDGNVVAVGDLAPCAYIVSIAVQILLTTGDSVPDNLDDRIAFCKA